MNELEVRLRDELRAAAGDGVLPPYLVPAAARSARRIRRRRTAAGGTLSAAALAAGLAGPAQRAADRADAGPSTATLATTTAPAAVVPDLLVTIVHTDCRESARGAGTTCYRTELRFTPPIHPVPPPWVEQGDIGTRPVEEPGEVLVSFSDGTVARERVTRTGAREWTARVDVPDGAEVDAIQVVAARPGELYVVPTPSG